MISVIKSFFVRLFKLKTLYLITFIIVSISVAFLFIFLYKQIKNDENVDLWFKSNLRATHDKILLDNINANINASVKNITNKFNTGLVYNSENLVDSIKVATIPWDKIQENNEDPLILEYKKGYFFKINNKKEKNKPDLIEIEKYRINNERTLTIYSVFIASLKNIVLAKNSAGDNIDESEKVNYSQYSERLLESFNLKGLFTQYLPGVKVGKIYMAGEDSSIVIYPCHQKRFKFIPQSRDWWKTAYPPKNEVLTNIDLLAPNSSSGLTPIYADINNDNGQTELVRTYWYKINDENRRYLICIDFHYDGSTKFNESYFNYIPFKAALPLFLLFTLASLFFLGYKINRKYMVQSEFGLYRLERIDKKYVSAKSEINLETTTRIAKDYSYVQRLTFGSNWSQNGLTRIEYTDSNSFQKSEGTALTLTKRFNMSLNSPFNTKAVEIWRMVKISNGLDVGQIEILWLSNANKELELDYIFWDSGLDKNVIGPKLSDHILKSESPQFVFDPSINEDESVDHVLSKLSRIPAIEAFCQRADTFSKRKFKFSFSDDGIVDFISNLYSGNNVEAVCSVEFLKKLKKTGKFNEVLGIPVSRRFIIEPPQNEFKTFVDTELKNELEPFKNLLLKAPFTVAKLDTQKEVAYKNRDFAVIEFGKNIRCVLIPDIIEGNISSGWISWRETDVAYYKAVIDYLNNTNNIQIYSVGDYLRV